MLVAFVVFVSTLAVDSPECAATSMIAEARAASTDAVLHVRLAEASAHAEASARAVGRRDQWWYCKQALLAFAELAPAALGPERGESEAKRARQIAVELAIALGPYTAPQPELNPVQQWERRRRVLIGHTAASGFVTAVGLGLLIVPWPALAVCLARDDRLDAPACNGLSPIIMSMLGAGVLIGSSVPLVVWSYRLNKHMLTPPPGVALGRARARWLGAGLRLDF